MPPCSNGNSFTWACGEHPAMVPPGYHTEAGEWRHLLPFRPHAAGGF